MGCAVHAWCMYVMLLSVANSARLYCMCVHAASCCLVCVHVHDRSRVIDSVSASCVVNAVNAVNAVLHAYYVA